MKPDGDTFTMAGGGGLTRQLPAGKLRARWRSQLRRARAMAASVAALEAAIHELELDLDREGAAK